MDYQPYDFFMLRRTAMPTNTLLALHEQTGHDFQKWEKALLTLFQTTDFGKALYLASPTLYAAIEAYDEKAQEKARQKVLFSAYKYLIRMCSRATPFGIFSVTSSGTISESTRLIANGIGQPVLMLKMSVLSRIASWIENQRDMAKNIRYLSSSSLYMTYSSFRYIERQPPGGASGPLLSAIDRSPELAALLRSAQNPSTRYELTSGLSQVLSPAKAVALVQAAIDAGVLVSEFTANITGDDFQNRLRGALDAMATSFPEADKLGTLVKSLPKETSLRSLKETTSALEGFFPELSGRSLFRAQLTSPGGKVKLGRAAIALLVSDFAAVRGLLQQSPSDPTPLDELKAKFRIRYGQRQVPLCELMESDLGMRYAGLSIRTATLWEKLEFASESAQPSTAITAVGRIKQKIFDRALSRQLYSVNILENDLTGLAAPKTGGLGQFLLGEMLAASSRNVDRGDFKFYLKNVGGESGFELMSRFAQHDPVLATKLQKATKQTEELDELLLHAEIAHIPSDETATVLARPHLWPYEIPYLSSSTLPATNQIPVTDILVSVERSGEMVLSSKRYAKRIIPHNTTAHNYVRGLPVYQLLSDLAFEKSAVTAWNWEHLESFTFLPRVVYRHLILCAARWNLAGETRRMILNSISSELQWQKLRTQLRIPRYVHICQGDNWLLIDCENPFAKALLQQELEKNDHLQIQECLQSGRLHLVKGKEGKFSHELLLAIRTVAPAIKETTTFKPAEQKFFHLGSQWVYVKIFTDPEKVDCLLTEIVSELCQHPLYNELIRKWFFIRYNDPAHHLRLRFELTAIEDRQVLLARLSIALDRFLLDGTIEKIQFDTYERELERYASLDYEHTESIFHQDSQACVRAVSLLKNDPSDNGRWQAALYSVDLMLSDFGMSIQARAYFAQQSFEGFLNEFGENQTLTRQLDQKFRYYRSEIQQTLGGHSPLRKMLAGCFSQRSETIRQRTMSVGPSEISSYVHMAVNRILEDNHRRQEMILFHFLKKYYHSAVKRCTN